jgi:hypothetical protein
LEIIIVKTDILSIADLNKSPWILIGCGGFAQQLLLRCDQLNVRRPDLILGYQTDIDYFEGIQVLNENDYHLSAGQRLVFGSFIYQFEIEKRFSQRAQNDCVIYDCSADLWSDQNMQMFDFEISLSTARPLMLIFCNSPYDQLNIWLSKFVETFEVMGGVVSIKHSLQRVINEELTAASKIYMWNGSLPCFESIKQRLHKLNISFQYLECGFFPQSSYFYIDDEGINNRRSIANDPLLWVTQEMRESADTLRKAFFKNIQVDEQDFIFIPLQLAHDSNIQQNSRFKNGMQEFIDFIEDYYPNDKLLFKKHPKDLNNYVTRKGAFSQADSRELILQSRLIHGINSSVLFEAALAGKPLVAEGDCLLNHKFANHNTVISAIIATQISVEGPFDFLTNVHCNKLTIQRSECA